VTPASRTRAFIAIVLMPFIALSISGCAEVEGAAPRCDEARRLAVVAQSVPGAAYIPCLRDLRPGWSASDFDPQSGGTHFSLVSDRDPDHEIAIEFRAACDVAGATATTPRADGARTYLQLRSISPRYAGTLMDVFSGGCVSYRFDFARGPHIGLIDDFENQVGLLARRELALTLRTSYDVELGP